MSTELSLEEAESIQVYVGNEIKRILEQLESNISGMTTGFTSLTRGGMAGAACLSSLGVPGPFSLKWKNKWIEFGIFIAGVFVLKLGGIAGYLALLCLAVGYLIVKKRIIKKHSHALNSALLDLDSILNLLVPHDRYFRQEITGIRMLKDTLASRGARIT